jgi:hypothetical protein
LSYTTTALEQHNNLDIGTPVNCMARKQRTGDGWYINHYIAISAQRFYFVSSSVKFSIVLAPLSAPTSTTALSSPSTCPSGFASTFFG